MNFPELTASNAESVNSGAWSCEAELFGIARRSRVLCPPGEPGRGVIEGKPPPPDFLEPRSDWTGDGATADLEEEEEEAGATWDEFRFRFFVVVKEEEEEGGKSESPGGWLEGVGCCCCCCFPFDRLVEDAPPFLPPLNKSPTPNTSTV